MDIEKMRTQEVPSGFVESELYEDLLTRFERLLAYSSTLQTRVSRLERGAGRLGKLAKENSRLRTRLGLDDVYIALLEQTLEAVDILPVGERPKALDQETERISRPNGQDRMLRLARAPRRKVGF